MAAATTHMGSKLDKLGAPNRMLVYAIVGVLLFFGWPTGSTPFIYFQF